MPKPKPPPPILAEVRALAKAQKLSVRALRNEGVPARAAEAILGLNKSTPSVASLEAVLRALTPPRTLWHERA